MYIYIYVYIVCIRGTQEFYRGIEGLGIEQNYG